MLSNVEFKKRKITAFYFKELTINGKYLVHSQFCAITTSITSKHFHHIRGNPVSIKHVLCILPSLQPLAATNTHCLYGCTYAEVFQLQGNMEYVIFCV